MQIVEKELQALQAYENNPRKNEAAVQAVAESIREFGFKVPIVIDSDGVIVAGHTRVMAARQLGLTQVPCIVADDLTPDQIRAFRLADNKTAELAEWDLEALAKELDAIEQIDMDRFGFDLSEFEAAVKVEDDEFEPELPEEPFTHEGELWELGEHRLLVGDSTKAEDVAKLMGGETADLIVTDPPYNIDYTGCTKDALKIQNDKMSDEDYVAFLRTCTENGINVLKEGGAFYIWYANTESRNVLEAMSQAGAQIRQYLIWVKSLFSLGRQDYQWRHEPCLYGWKEGAAHYFVDDRTQSTVLEEDKPTRSADHPTMKPVPLFGRLIQNSTKPGEIVLDLFAGSGTTVIAAEQLGRRAFVMEFDPHYADVIIRRYEEFTGKQAKKL